MNFKDFFQKHSVLTEISQKYVDKLPQNIKQLLADEKLPFNKIFGNKLRIAQPLKGGKEYKMNISKHIGDQYEVDFDKWVGFKISDKDKKNPVRLGKLLSKRKAEFEKWAKETKDAESKKIFSNNVLELDKLLKTTNLQKQVTDAEKTSLYVIYSRAPIDVLRMGDIETKNPSCHREDGNYFYCALADAMLNAGIAYLVSEEDYENYELDNDEILQDDEIFSDRDRNIDGISPLARIRIRLVLDSDGNELAVPTTKIYAKPGYEYNDDFREQLIKWAKQQDVSNFNWDSTLSLKGGSYEDYGYLITNQVKLIWDKEIKYRTTSDDSEFQQEIDDEEGIYEEHFYDEVVNELDRNEDSEIIEAFFGENHGDAGIDISIRHRGRIEFSFQIPETIVEMIGTDELDQPKTVDGWVLSKSYGHYYFKSYADAPSIYDYGEFWGRDDWGTFDYEGYYEKCRGIIQTRLNAFSSEGYQSDHAELAFNYRYGFNKKVLEIFGKSIDFEDKVHIYYGQIIEELLDTNYYYGTDTELLEEFEIESLKNFRISRHDIQTLTEYGHKKLNIILSATDTQKLKTALAIIENHFHDIISNLYPGVLDLSGIDIDYKLSLPARDDYYNDSTREVSFKDIYPDTIMSNRYKTVIVDKKLAYPTVDFRITHDTSNVNDLSNIIDHMKLQEVYKMIKTLSELDEEEKEEFLKIEELKVKLNSNRAKEYYDELKRQGQLELDLNKINRDMPRKPTTFDNVYNNILLELNFGKGGLSNMSGQQGNVASSAPANASATPKSGVQMKFAGNPKFSSQTPGANINPATANAQTGANQTNVQQDPQEIEEFTNLLTTRQQNPAQFQKASQQLLQDPDRYGRFLDFITQQTLNK